MTFNNYDLKILGIRKAAAPQTPRSFWLKNHEKSWFSIRKRWNIKILIEKSWVLMLFQWKNMNNFSFSNHEQLWLFLEKLGVSFCFVWRIMVFHVFQWKFMVIHVSSMKNHDFSYFTFKNCGGPGGGSPPDSSDLKIDVIENHRCVQIWNIYDGDATLYQEAASFRCLIGMLVCLLRQPMYNLVRSLTAFVCCAPGGGGGGGGGGTTMLWAFSSLSGGGGDGGASVSRNLVSV